MGSIKPTISSAFNRGIAFARLFRRTSGFPLQESCTPDTICSLQNWCNSDGVESFLVLFELFEKKNYLILFLCRDIIFFLLSGNISTDLRWTFYTKIFFDIRPLFLIDLWCYDTTYTYVVGWIVLERP